MRLRSRHPFVPAAQNLSDNLARLGICASEWTNHKWKMEYCENASRLRAFVLGTNVRPVVIGLLQAAWVKLNHLQTGVGRFNLSMHKWGLAPSLNCECVASGQTADHVPTACSIHQAPHGALGLTVSSFFFYFYLYIYPPDLQESNGGAIHKVSNYPDLLPKMPRYCCLLVI